MRNAFIVLTSLAIALSASAASKVKVGTGTEKIALPHVEGTRFNKADGTSVITLLFSEKKPEAVVLVDSFGGDDLSLAKWMSTTGEAVAAKVEFTEGQEENYSMTLFLGGESVAVGAHASGGEAKGLFRKLELKDDKISGTIDRAQQPGAMSGTFDTKLRTIAEPKWVSGADVAKSPQGQALLAYASAMLKFDFAGASRHSVRDEVAESARTKQMMGEKRMKDMIRMEFGTAKDFAKRLSSADASMAATEDRTRIRIVQRDPDGSTMTSTIGLQKVDGAWKVNW
jgi:hypothetical protein